jgi:hypothetical protein
MAKLRKAILIGTLEVWALEDTQPYRLGDLNGTHLICDGRRYILHAHSHPTVKATDFPLDERRG